MDAQIIPCIFAGLFLIVVVSALFGLAVLDLVIVAEQLRRRMAVSCLALIALSFITAFAFESLGRCPGFWVLSFFFAFFSLPLFSFYALNRAGRIHSKSENRKARIFEGAVIAAFIPCLLGLFLTTLGCCAANVDSEVTHGRGWAHL